MALVKNILLLVMLVLVGSTNAYTYSLTVDQYPRASASILFAFAWLVVLTLAQISGWL